MFVLAKYEFWSAIDFFYIFFGIRSLEPIEIRAPIELHIGPGLTVGKSPWGLARSLARLLRFARNDGFILGAGKSIETEDKYFECSLGIS